MKRRIGSILLATAMLLAMLAGCSSSTTDAATNSGDAAGGDATGGDASVEAVKIGVLLPMSGTTSYYGEVQLGGIELCVEYINDNGGVASLGGAPIELIVADSAGSSETGMSEFERLIDEGVCAVIGPYNSAVAAATAPLAIQYGIPYVVVNATADNFMNDPNKYVYRTNTGSFDFYNVLEAMYDNVNAQMDGGVNSVAMVYDSGDWGTSIYNNWVTLAEAKGFDLAVSEAVSNVADMTTLVNKIKAADVDLVAGSVFSSDANLLVRTLSEYDANTMIFGTGGGFSDQAFLTNLGDMADLCLQAVAFDPRYVDLSESAAEYNDRFLEDYGFNMTFEACFGWTGMATLYDAIERAASTDTEAIADALYETNITDRDNPALWFSIYEGIHFATDGQEIPGSDNLRYNNNDALGDMAEIIIQVQDGDWVSVLPTDIAQADLITELN